MQDMKQWVGMFCMSVCVCVCQRPTSPVRATGVDWHQHRDGLICIMLSFFSVLLKLVQTVGVTGKTITVESAQPTTLPVNWLSSHLNRTTWLFLVTWCETNQPGKADNLPWAPDPQGPLMSRVQFISVGCMFLLLTAVCLGICKASRVQIMDFMRHAQCEL